jgi:hypothetical protein
MAGMKDLKKGYGDQPVGILEDGFQRDMFLPRTNRSEAFKGRSKFMPRTNRKEGYQQVNDMNQNFQLLGLKREGYGYGGQGGGDCSMKILFVVLLLLAVFLILNMKKE